MPDLPLGDGVVHLLEKFFWVVAGVEDAVILADQFIPGILTDGAELVVHVSNCAVDVGDGHDGMLIEGEFLMGQILESSFTGGKAFDQRIFSQLAFRDVARDFGESPELSGIVVHGSDHDVGPKNRAVFPDSLRLLFEAPFGERLPQFAGRFVGFAILGGVETRKMLA